MCLGALLLPLPAWLHSQAQEPTLDAQEGVCKSFDPLGAYHVASWFRPRVQNANGKSSMGSSSGINRMSSSSNCIRLAMHP